MEVKNQKKITKQTNLNKRRLEQIPLKHQSLDELKELVSFLKSKGYKIIHGLNNIDECDHIIAVMINTDEKTLTKSNVTCMACWCDCKRHPLTIKQFFRYYDRLMIKKDEVFYNMLIESNIIGGKKMTRERELAHKIFDLEYLIESEEKPEYIDELADAINEYVPLANKLETVNDIWRTMCLIIFVVNKYPKLQNAMYSLKQKQLSLMGIK